MRSCTSDWRRYWINGDCILTRPRALKLPTHRSAGKFGRGIAYDPRRHAAFVDRMISIMTPEFLARCSGWGEPDPRPVFIVGFPRSGTTLTEQILASHPLVIGGERLHDLGVVFQALPRIVGGSVRVPLDALGQLGPASIKTAARRDPELRAPAPGNEAAEPYDLESDAWVVTTVSALAGGQKYLSLPGGYLVWDSSWPLTERNDKMADTLKDFLRKEALLSQ